jgi:hypothetical protein
MRRMCVCMAYCVCVCVCMCVCVNVFISVRMRPHLDVDGLVKAVHLVQQLEQNALHLAVRARLRIEA